MIGVAFLPIGIFFLNQRFFEMLPFSGAFALFPVIGFLIFAYLFNKAKAVEFDTENMYLTKGDVSETIALSNISVIKLTSFKMFTGYLWKIKYLDGMGIAQNARLLPQDDRKLEIFKTAVLAKNPGVEVINKPGVFDFDM